LACSQGPLLSLNEKYLANSAIKKTAGSRKRERGEGKAAAWRKATSLIATIALSPLVRALLSALGGGENGDRRSKRLACSGGRLPAVTWWQTWRKPGAEHYQLALSASFSLARHGILNSRPRARHACLDAPFASA